MSSGGELFAFVTETTKGFSLWSFATVTLHGAVCEKLWVFE